jgi:hypothetical protein
VFLETEGKRLLGKFGHKGEGNIKTGVK